MPHNQSDIPQLLEQCRAAMSVVLPPSVSFDEASENTRDEYKKLGCTLLRRAAKNGGRLSEVLPDTQRP